MSAAHLPVMLTECLDGLNVRPGRWYVDGTFGAGGHTRALLAAGANVLAIDQDPNITPHLTTLRKDFSEAVTHPIQSVAVPQAPHAVSTPFLQDDASHSIPRPGRFLSVQGNFRSLDSYAAERHLLPVAGVLLDLGLSSMQIDQAERGFAFRQAGPLDMRMSSEGPSAADLVNTLETDDLAALLYKYGEERYSRRLARAIVAARPITTTERLVSVIQSAYPGGKRRDHPARRSFQALRIAVNDELGALEDGLKAAEAALDEGGRLVVLSYHSLEDRTVKQFVRSSPKLQPLTKRPLTATPEEVERNPRARSAKLRIAEKRTPERSAENRVEAQP